MNHCRMCIKWEDEQELRIAELECCYVLLNRDQFFHGYAERIGEIRKAITI
jgi:hypothetical protein